MRTRIEKQKTKRDSGVFDMSRERKEKKQMTTDDHPTTTCHTM
jgi:hypothetical protein